MLEQRSFDVEPWAVREPGLDLEHLGHAESVFAFANGHIGLRGNLDEGDPTGCRARIATRSSSTARCPMPKAATDIRSRVRPS
jgi:glycosyl hydrolase family 65